MVEPILHYLIPTLMLLAFFPRKKKLILLLSPLSVIMDVDFLLRLHRWVLHSMATAVFASVAAYAVANALGVKAGKKDAGTAPALIVLFFVTSHLLLDVGSPGIPVLWPLSNSLYSIQLKFYTDPRTFSFTQDVVASVSPLEKALESQKTPYLTNTGAVSAILVGLILAARNILARRPIRR